MSCYEWENGTFKLPSKEYHRFKKEYFAAFNKWAEKEYQKKVDTWRRKEKRHGQLIFKRKPLKKDMRPGLLTNRDRQVVVPNTFQITFSDKTKCVTWNVDENNHACEYAREHKMGAEFLWMLQQVKWTSRTGGFIVGNDEYNRGDRDNPGGGGNYVKLTLGKYTKTGALGASYA